MLCFGQAQTPAANPAQPNASTAPAASQSNSNRGQSRKNRLQQLEDSLTRALQPFMSKQSIEPDLPPPVMQPPPVAPVMQNTRVKEMLDRRKNWMFMDPDDIILGKDHDNPLQIPEDMLEKDPRKSTASTDRLRNSLKGSPLDPKKDLLELNDPMGLNQPAGQREQKRPQDDAELPGGVREGIQSLRNMLATDPASGASTLSGKSSFADFFGLGTSSRSVADEAAHRAALEQYRQELDNIGRNKSTPGLLGSGEVASQPMGASGLEAFSIPRRTTIDAATPGGLSSLLHPGELEDPNAKVFNQWNRLYEPPRLESPKPEPATVPMVTVPKRKF